MPHKLFLKRFGPELSERTCCHDGSVLSAPASALTTSHAGEVANVTEELNQSFLFIVIN